MRERLTAIADAARTTATIPEGVTSTENFEGLDAFTAGVNPDDSPAHVQFFVAKVERLAASRLRQYCEQLHLTQSMVDQVSAALSLSLSSPPPPLFCFFSLTLAASLFHPSLDMDGNTLGDSQRAHSAA